MVNDELAQKGTLCRSKALRVTLEAVDTVTLYVTHPVVSGHSGTCSGPRKPSWAATQMGTLYKYKGSCLEIMHLAVSFDSGFKDLRRAHSKYMKTTGQQD